MAFSLDTKHEIIYLLGYPAKTIIKDSNLYNSFIDDRLEGIDSFTQDNVENTLKQIEEVRKNLSALKDQGKLKQVGDIVFNVDSNDRTVKSEYKRLVREIGSYLDIKYRPSSSSIFGVRK